MKTVNLTVDGSNFESVWISYIVKTLSEFYHSIGSGGGSVGRASD